MPFRFVHANMNICDAERSLAFYREALGLKLRRTHEAGDGSFTLYYLSDEDDRFEIELTWLRDHPQPYDLGENESHLAFVTEEYEASLAKHREMGCVCFENEAMGIYFIEDPDGYWLEIMPAR